MSGQGTLRSWSSVAHVFWAKGPPSLCRVAGQQPSRLWVLGLPTVLKSTEDPRELVFMGVTAIGIYLLKKENRVFRIFVNPCRYDDSPIPC